MATNPIAQTERQTGIATYAQPYVETMLGATMQNLFNIDPATGQVKGLKEYTPYSYRPEDYVAGMTDLQNKAMQGIASLQVPGYASEGANALRGLLNAGYTPASAQQVAADIIQAAQTDYKPTLEMYQAGPFERIADPRSMTEQGALEGYMSPYMQKVVDVQTQEAKRQAAIAQQAQQAQAARSGMFGGSGAALQRAQANAQLQRDLQNLQATGSQAAYQQAVQQFNAEQKARMEAALANQRAGIDVGGQNLSAKLAVQQLRTQTELQTALANMDNRQKAAVANQAAKLQAAGMNQSSALQAAIANQNAANAARQTSVAAANAMGNLGTSQLQNQLSVLNAQNQFGGQQQAMNQKAIDTAVQNYNTAQQYPYMQLGFMQNMLGGLPIGTSSEQIYQAAPSLSSQLLGAGTALIGANQLLGGGGGGGGGGRTSGGGTSGGGGLGGILNSVAGGIGNAVSNTVGNVLGGIGSAFGFADGGYIYDQDPAGLQALALSKI